MKKWTTPAGIVLVVIIIAALFWVAGDDKADRPTIPAPESAETVEENVKDVSETADAIDPATPELPEVVVDSTTPPQEYDPYTGQTFTQYYEYDRDKKEIEQEGIPLECLEPGEDYASKPYFINNDECAYCDPGSITDEERDECFDMQEICVEIRGEGAVSPSDGKCICGHGYRISRGMCKLVEE